MCLANGVRCVSLIGNILWFILGGIFTGIGWYIVGFLWCLTVIGIPIGLQCFKMGRLSFFPFGSDVLYGGGAGSLLLNVLWLIFGGLELALTHLLFGLIWCVTIIGIPFGFQHFNLARLALLPFGAKIIDRD